MTWSTGVEPSRAIREAAHGVENAVRASWLTVPMSVISTSKGCGSPLQRSLTFAIPASMSAISSLAWRCQVRLITPFSKSSRRAFPLSMGVGFNGGLLADCMFLTVKLSQCSAHRGLTDAMNRLFSLSCVVWGTSRGKSPWTSPPTISSVESAAQHACPQSHYLPAHIDIETGHFNKGTCALADVRSLLVGGTAPPGGACRGGSSWSGQVCPLRCCGWVCKRVPARDHWRK